MPLTAFFAMTSAVFGWSLCWYVRALLFYSRNGWDFSKDFGPDFYHGDGPDDPRMKMKPEEKMWRGYPLFILIFGLFSILFGLGVFGIIEFKHHT
ncbi:hypothetical protein [Pararhizobium sp. DWP1-1-3]|uniref:hypothetical protein n=1 Tax=Pararhizobium sp. DWP1-1-3 TaxID=2804652 RepID=UPI003CF5E90E